MHNAISDRVLGHNPQMGYQYQGKLDSRGNQKGLTTVKWLTARTFLNCQIFSGSIKDHQQKNYTQKWECIHENTNECSTPNLDENEQKVANLIRAGTGCVK